MIDKRENYNFLPLLERGPRRNTTEQVEQTLRSAIVALDFAPGEFLDKGLICARLGISKFPVSEALARLATEGLVEILPQRCTRVACIRLSDVKESMLIRGALEAIVAETAAQRLPALALAALRENLQAQEDAVARGDSAGFHTLDLAFHAILVDSLELPRVAAVIKAARANIDRVCRLLSFPRGLAVTLAEHRDLLKALGAHDGAAARQAMETHLGGILEELEHFGAARPDVFAPHSKVT
jgi:DNA-binding GntR family transcriptional regulator